MEQFTMTEEEKREYIKEVNEGFMKKTPMTSEERKAVRSWMAEGHCILEPWDSPNLPGPMYPPYDFLDCYRLDREIERETAGMNRDEKIRYLKEYWVGMTMRKKQRNRLRLWRRPRNRSER